MEPTPETTAVQRNSRSFPAKRFFTVFALILLIAFLYVIFLTTPPQKSNSDVQRVEVLPGMSVANIAEAAKDAGVVRSSFLLYTLLTVQHDPTAIYAGVYSFTAPRSVFSVANQFGTGGIDDTSVRLTIPEGMRAKDIAALIENALPHISASAYEALATPHEGYLYPETYFIPQAFTAEDIVRLQRETYAERTLPLRQYLEANQLSEYEVLTLASIIEREANDETSMRMVAGIFLNRLNIGMALQADASIEYTIDVPLNELEAGELAAKLREVDSPYNTYRYPGLPPTPISNPGLTAIKAVLEPLPSDYFYYLTDNEGTFYYARTLDEHNENIARYLK